MKITFLVGVRFEKYLVALLFTIIFMSKMLIATLKIWQMLFSEIGLVIEVRRKGEMRWSPTVMAGRFCAVLLLYFCKNQFFQV